MNKCVNGPAVKLGFEENGMYGLCCKAEVLPEFNFESGLLPYEDAIGCEMLDGMDVGHGINMLFDGEADVNKATQYNWIATAFRTAYWTQCDDICVPCKSAPVLGQVILVNCNEDDRFCALTEEQLAYIETITGKLR